MTTTAQHIENLKAMTTRTEAEAYVAKIRGAELADLAKASCATGSVANKRAHIVQRHVGARLASAVLRAL